MATLLECHSYRKEVQITVATNLTYTLSDKPDTTGRVHINGYTETRVEDDIQSNQYYVNYATGKITFGSGMKSKSVTIIYYTKGAWK